MKFLMIFLPCLLLNCRTVESKENVTQWRNNKVNIYQDNLPTGRSGILGFEFSINTFSNPQYAAANKDGNKTDCLQDDQQIKFSDIRYDNNADSKKKALQEAVKLDVFNASNRKVFVPIFSPIADNIYYKNCEKLLTDLRDITKCCGRI